MKANDERLHLQSLELRYREKLGNQTMTDFEISSVNFREQTLAEMFYCAHILTSERGLDRLKFDSIDTNQDLPEWAVSYLAAKVSNLRQLYVQNLANSSS